MTTDKPILDFLRFCVTQSQEIPDSINQLSWQALYDFAKSQTLIGICFEGISKLDNPSIPKPLLYQWMTEAEQLRRQNIHLNLTAARAFAQLYKAGFQSCLLKGQGNTLRYPAPYTRTPGDIDLWVKASRKEIIKYAKEHFSEMDEINLQHAGVKKDGVEVELHFTPSVVSNPIYRHRQQRWFRSQMEEQFNHLIELPENVGAICAPTTDFNLVYQICHMQHHLIDEGLGLRQVVDYYYVLQQAKKENSSLLRQHGQNQYPLEKLLKHLNLWKFATAMMYVMRELFDLPDDSMIAPIHEARGRYVLQELLIGGNFGRSDTRYGRFIYQPKYKKYFLKTWRVLNSARYFPEECLCEPIFRLYHFGWRLWMNHIKIKK